MKKLYSKVGCILILMTTRIVSLSAFIEHSFFDRNLQIQSNNSMDNEISDNFYQLENIESFDFDSSLESTTISNYDGMFHTQSDWTYENEPNGYFCQSAHMGMFGFGQQKKYLSGKIGDPFTDVDIYDFKMETSGRIKISARWWGSYKGHGREDGLRITLYAHDRSFIASSLFASANSDSVQVLEIDLIPQSWYIVISTRNNSDRDLFENQDYIVSVDFEQTSKPTSLLINDYPTKLNYLQGQLIDLSNGRIEVVYDDGTKGYMQLTYDMISGYNPNTTVFGPQTVTVSYGGKTTTFQVLLDRFSDVPYGHRNYTHINKLVGLSIINGYNDSTFRPNNTLTRAQAAIMIARAIGLSTEGVNSNFSDVPSTHSAYKFISAAQNAGIINGYSDGTFRPNASITRAQIAVMVQRAFQIQASGTAVSFSDVPVGYGPKTFIETLASQKIVNGYSDGTFKPTNNVTRAQFSTMINNAIEYSKVR